MYDEELTRIPKDTDDMWVLLGEQFEYARLILLDTTVQTQADVFDKARFAEHRRLQALGALVSYRGTSAELDNRDHYIDMGRRLIAPIEEALNARRITPAFVQQWGTLTFCMGFVSSYMMDNSDSLAPKRGGKTTGDFNSKAAQMQWVARVLLSLRDSGMSRKEADATLVSYARRVLERVDLQHGFGRAWFQSILGSEGHLGSVFTEKRLFSFKEMERLVAEPNPHPIPPLPMLPLRS